jgi:hypothetical protein
MKRTHGQDSGTRKYSAPGAGGHSLSSSSATVQAAPPAVPAPAGRQLVAPATPVTWHRYIDSRMRQFSTR